MNQNYKVWLYEQILCEKHPKVLAETFLLYYDMRSFQWDSVGTTVKVRLELFISGCSETFDSLVDMRRTSETSYLGSKRTCLTDCGADGGAKKDLVWFFSGD